MWSQIMACETSKSKQRPKLFLPEPLPPHQEEILDHAVEQNLITTTNYCKVKVFCKDQAGKFNGSAVNSKKAVDDFKK